MGRNIYLIGSLRNPQIPIIANQLEQDGHSVFADWFGAGERADDAWRDYEKARGRTYLQALKGYAARHVFEFDLHHLKLADTVILVLPAGRSGHLELGWALGQGKEGFILLDNAERWDVMNLFCTEIFDNLDALRQQLGGAQ